MEGGPLMWMLPLYLHVNQKSDYDDDDDDDDDRITCINVHKQADQSMICFEKKAKGVFLCIYDN